MIHDYIQLEEKEATQKISLLHKDYNLDKKDNLDSLPEAPAVYAICGIVNGQPANARFVGITDNLLAAVKQHYTDSESNECLRTFMRSIKLKQLIYQVLPSATQEERAEHKQEWEKKFRPRCSDEMNQVY